MSAVPNQFPARQGALRIALVGEAPGSDEERQGVPFVGSSGFLLNTLLASVGIDREACFVGNVCQHRPPNNELAAWPWEDERIQEGIHQLLSDLRLYAPNVVVTLGNVPLHLFKHGNTPPPRTKRGTINWPSKVTVWRGSMWLSHFPSGDELLPKLEGELRILTRPWKTLTTLHPAYVLRAWSNHFDLRQDLARAREEGTSPTLTLPQLAVAYGPID